MHGVLWHIPGGPDAATDGPLTDEQQTSKANAAWAVHDPLLPFHDQFCCNVMHNAFRQQRGNVWA